MAKYNLLNNGNIYSLTTSGTGNKELDFGQLTTLLDGEVYTGGVVLSSSDSLYLEGDLHNRIKIHEVRIYAENLTLLSGIDFYYKDDTEDQYISCVKGVTTDYYYATIPGVSAPRYILTTISGFDSNIYEYQVLNNDYIVGFGDDGSKSAVYLDKAPSGEESDPYPIPIYNNSTEQYPANAYIIVDDTGEAEDMYLKISTTASGIYTGIEEGITLTNNDYSSRYKWNTGTLDNVEIIDNDYIQLIASAGAPYPGKLTTLPSAFNIGAQAWEYDAITNTLYTSHYDGILKLYKYEVSIYTWTFISEIPLNVPTTSHNEYTIMVKAGDYIYYFLHSNYAYSQFFGRYDLNGVQGNWEWLYPLGDVSFVVRPGGNCMVYDGNDYIYAIASNYSAKFARYTITTDTWQGMNTLFDDNGLGSIGRMSAAYDSDRDCIYLVCGDHDTYGYYVQRYNVADDTWNKYFFNFHDRISEDFTHVCISYYDNRLFFRNDSYGTLVYIYDITTDTVSSVDIGFVQADSFYAYNILVGPPKDTDDDFSLFQTNVGGDSEGVYVYNIPTVGGVYSSGAYTTPIFDLADKYNATYYNINEVTTSGLSIVSKDIDAVPGTIEVRSSDVAPTPIINIYLPYTANNGYINLYKVDINNNNSSFYLVNTGSYVAPKSVAVDWRRNRKFVSLDHVQSTTNNMIYVLGPDDTILYTNVSTGSAALEDNYFYAHLEYAYDGNLWAYSEEGSILNHISADLATLLYYKEIETILDISSEYDGNGVWYVDNNKVVYMDSTGSIDFQTYVMTSPAVIAASDSGTCWVSDIVELKLYNISKDNVVIKTVDCAKPIHYMVRDYVGGFYACAGASEGDVYHYNKYGTMDMHINIDAATHIKGCPYGCIVYESINLKLYYVDLSTATIKRIITAPRETYLGLPDIFWCDNESAQVNNVELGENLLPISYDDIWGDTGTLQWKEVPKEGSFLTKDRYQQSRITLYAESLYTNAEVHSITIPKPIKVSGIQPQTSQDIYAKTNIPSDATITDFSGRLKTWWDVQE